MTPSASQTVGPFFNFALTVNPAMGVIAGLGERIELTIRVIDGDGIPLPGDAMIELWQTDAHGRYAHPRDPRANQVTPEFCGFGRLETSLDGKCVFQTLRPGPIGPGHAPHINVVIFARGLLKQLYTRIYFGDDKLNDNDPLLALVPEDRRQTLLAQQVDTHSWAIDIQLQGGNETIFFEV